MVVASCFAALGLVSGCPSAEAPTDGDAEHAAVEAQEALENEEAPMPSSPLTAGQEVFDLSALAHTGQRVELGRFLERPVVVYFCPSDRAQLCTDLALALKQQWLELNAHLSMVFAVTPEPTVVHRDFATEHELPHLFISDQSGVVHRLFGLAPGVATSYLIGTDRKVLRVLPTQSGADHVAELRRALSELQLLRDPYPL